MDATPGTTADTKVQLMELHSVGPAKLFDTGGWVPCCEGRLQWTEWVGG